MEQQVTASVHNSIQPLRDTPRCQGISVTAFVSCLFSLGQQHDQRSAHSFFFCQRKKKKEIKSRLLTVSFLGQRVEKRGRGRYLWIQLVPVCRCLGVPGHVFPALTVDLTPHWCTVCIQVKSFSGTLVTDRDFALHVLWIWHFCAPRQCCFFSLYVLS